jgi:hypothetical protein
LNREFKNFRRGVSEIPSPIEIGFGISENAAAKIFGLLFIGYLNLVLERPIQEIDPEIISNEYSEYKIGGKGYLALHCKTFPRK